MTSPIVLHANDEPSVLGRLVIERLCERADLGVGQALRWSIGIFASRVIVQDDHREPRAAASSCIFGHLPVTDGVADGEIWPSADHQVDALSLARVVVIEDELRLLDQHWLPVRSVLIANHSGGADHLLGRNAVGPLGVGPHKILPAAGHDVGLVAVGPEVFQKLGLWRIDEISVRPLPALIAGRAHPRHHFVAVCINVNPGQRRADDLEKIVHRQLRHRLAIP
jgi:hypothetical protein